MRERKALVVGLGNPLLGDDGFGVRVAHRLRRAPGAGTVFDVVSAGTDLLARLDDFDAYEIVVLVDALLDGRSAGAIRVVDESELAAWGAPSRNAHQLSVAEAIRLFRVLHPDSSTRIVLVALATDRIARRPVHASASAVRDGAGIVARLLA